MEKERFLYFGYASNLLKERLLVDKPGAYKKFICVGKLKNYKLTFDRIWPLPGDWHGPCATIRPQDGSETWGVVWELQVTDKDLLMGQDALLRTFNTDIEDKAGNTYNCLVFEMVNGDHPGEAPSPQYKDVIVRGAKQSGLPKHYIQFLESFQDNGYNGPHLLYQQIIDNLENDNNNIKICNDNGEN